MKSTDEMVDKLRTRQEDDLVNEDKANDEEEKTKDEEEEDDDDDDEKEEKEDEEDNEKEREIGQGKMAKRDDEDEDGDDEDDDDEKEEKEDEDGEEKEEEEDEKEEKEEDEMEEMEEKEEDEMEEMEEKEEDEKEVKEENEQDGDEDDDDDDDDDEDEDEEEPRAEPRSTMLYDFDKMMAKKKEESSRKRKRRNYDIINDNDDIIADIVNQMRDAVEADNEANRSKMAAAKKLKLLPFVMSQLRKVDLRDAFLDSDVLSVITEWLAPLPDRSLPHLTIRDNFLKILIDFNLYDVDRIKGSGIGKAVMYLYKHPKETKENKQRAKQLISCWSRPIFQLDSSFNSISREEREQRDLELMSKQRRTSKNDSPDGDRPGPSSGPRRKDDPAQKPGDKGWIPRARVPAPSMKDYVIRPRSKVDGDVGKSSKRPANMLEKYMKNQQERRRANRQQRAINMKIDRV